MFKKIIADILLIDKTGRNVLSF